MLADKCESWEDGESPWRGGSGPMKTQWARNDDPLLTDWKQACVEAGFGLTNDYNGEQPEGFGDSQSTIAGGRLASSPSLRCT